MNIELSKVIIRDAVAGDLHALLEFEQGVLTAERPFDPTLRAKTTYYDLEVMLASENVKLLVAELKNRNATTNIRIMLISDLCMCCPNTGEKA